MSSTVSVSSDRFGKNHSHKIPIELVNIFDTIEMLHLIHISISFSVHLDVIQV